MRSNLLQICFFCLSLAIASPDYLQGQSEVVQTLKEEEKVMTGYYLLPSTLRMINLQRDPDFDKLVRPIRKLSVLSMRTEMFTLEDLRNSAGKIIAEEGYESYAEVEGPEQSVFVLGKPKKEQTCVLAYFDEQCLISEIQGKIDIFQLTKLYGKVMNDTTSRDSTAGAFDGSFVNIFDLIVDDNNLKKRREDREKKRLEEKKKKQDRAKGIETEEAIEVSDSIVIKMES